MLKVRERNVVATLSTSINAGVLQQDVDIYTCVIENLAGSKLMEKKRMMQRESNVRGFSPSTKTQMECY